MDTVQSARVLARTRKFSTNIVRPLLTSRTSVNGDGTAPDFAHAPLYPAIAAAAMRATGRTGPGQGDREAALVSLVFWAAGAAASAGLARLLFPGAWFGRGIGPLAGAFCAFAGISLSLTPHPATLAALLFTLLLGVLWGLDTVPLAGDNPPRAPLGMAAAAGALFGLLFLTVYSALALVPALLLYLWRTTGAGRSRPLVVTVFLLTALTVASPLLLRNIRLTHNPFYNSRLAELVMHTASFPGTSLYQAATMPRARGAYLAGGGAGEMVQKIGSGLSGMCAQFPAVVGLLVVPLFVLSPLTRFAEGRVNRLRTLVFACLACQVLGLSLFLPAPEAAPVLLIYAPWASILAAGFLLTLVRARNWPAFCGRMAVWGWVFVAAVPALSQLLGGTATGNVEAHRRRPYAVWAFLNTAPQIATLRAATRAKNAAPAYLTSDAPEEAAFRLDQPTVLLPATATDMQAVAARTGRPVAGIILTPDLYKKRSDGLLEPWIATYNRVLSLDRVAVVLEAPLRRNVIEHTRFYYPPPLAAGMKGFRPAPYGERDGSEYSLLFWRPYALSGGTNSAFVGDSPPR